LQAEPATRTHTHRFTEGQMEEGEGKGERGNRGQWHLDKGPGGASKGRGFPLPPLTHKSWQL